MRRLGSWVLALCIGLVSLLPVSGYATAPRIVAAQFDQAPLLDGEVRNDSIWQSATPATGFRQVRPYEGLMATQRTEVFVGFTDSALYIGVICYDDEPEAMLVTDSRRDASLDDTDSF